MPKEDYFNFPWRDWLTNLSVRALTPEQRDFCITLKCLMAGGNPRGTLTVDGRAMSRAQVSNATGVPQEHAVAMLGSILATGVLQRDEATGVIYDQQMVRDRDISLMRQEVGRLGGNPALKPRPLPLEGVEVSQVVNQSNGEPGKKTQPHHLPWDWAPTAEEQERLLQLARDFWPLMPAAELEEKVAKVTREFKDYWHEMRRQDEANRTRKGLKASWYMALRNRLRDVYDRERREEGLRKLRDPASAGGEVMGALGDARQDAACVMCAAAQRDPSLPPCQFHKDKER